MLEILLDYGVMFLVGTWPNGPIGGFSATLILAALGMAGAFPLALLIGLARTGSWTWARWLATGWVYVFRGVPLVMTIFWAYFLLPNITGVAVSAFTTALCAIIVYESAFLGEIVRAGLEGLPRGQTEAARAGGLSYLQAMRSVIMPQALANMLPSLVNQLVSTIKATSIVYVIGVQEVTFVANQVNSIEMDKALQTFLVLACFYFVGCYAISLGAQRLEARMAKRRMSVA